MTTNINQTEMVGADTTKVSKKSRFNYGVMIGLGLIILLGAYLRFYKLGAYSIGNTYYAATVQSMLTSWKNFFFAAFEPGGSVTVDKPPLGFWVQAISAYFLGVNGFALALPQALAGLLSIPLLYTLVKRYFGIFAGLISALVLAVVPSPSLQNATIQLTACWFSSYCSQPGHSSKRQKAENSPSFSWEHFSWV